MEFVVVSIVAIVVSGLTFFSGFGLGTLLMPAFALFFPVEAAVAATAIVHLANNLFKVGLIGKHADFKVVIRFAIPASIAAALGAYVLSFISDLNYLMSYQIGGKEYFITPVKLIIALLMIVFALIELIPQFSNIQIKDKYIPLGGVLSGFFGGISGHQGALRTAFLVRTGLEKNALIGTMVTSAVVVDISRLIVYGITFFSKDIAVMEQQGIFNVILVGIAAAFIGAFIGRKLLDKVTLQGIQITVAIMLLILSIGLASGII
ncbi:MAG: sulfite exporter TauE/SafE family protein [Melioribacteraceae bacterium]|nr:sulfite exporter TauE/SafE family protein [Melioribacteraceae bacterium]